MVANLDEAEVRRRMRVHEIEQEYLPHIAAWNELRYKFEHAKLDDGDFNGAYQKANALLGTIAAGRPSSGKGLRELLLIVHGVQAARECARDHWTADQPISQLTGRAIAALDDVTRCEA